MAFLNRLPDDAVPVDDSNSLPMGPRDAQADLPQQGPVLGPRDLPLDAVPIDPEPSVAPPAPPEGPSFGERVTELTKERYDRLARMREEYLTGDVTAPEFYAARMATSMGTFFDVAGEGVLTVLSALTPDKWENVFKEAIATGGNRLMDTDTAKSLLAAWQGLDQLTKDRIANTADLTAGIGSQTKIGKAISPTAQTGKKLTASAIKADKKNLAPIVLDQNFDIKQNRGKETNLPPEKQYQLNYDEEILTTVLSLPHITGSSKPNQILGAINYELSKVSKRINKALVKTPSRVMKASVNKEVGLKIAELYDDYPILNTDKTLKEVQKQVLNQVRTALDDFDGKPINLLKARKKLDASIELTFGDQIYEGNSAARKLVQKARQAFNELAAKAVDDEDIKALLRRQHILLEALDNTSYVKAKEKPIKGIVKKAANFVERYPYIAAGAVGFTGERTGLLSSIPNEFILGAGVVGSGVLAADPNVRRAAGGLFQAAPVSTSAMYGTANTLSQQEQETP